LTSAAADAADLARFLADADLAHFDLHAEFRRKNADHLTEVYAVICGIKEGSFFAIGLYLHFAELHLQAQSPGHLAAAGQDFGFAVFTDAETFDVAFAAAPEYFLDFGAELVY